MRRPSTAKQAKKTTGPVGRVHLCKVCSQRGHHANSCPLLAARVLKALTRHSQAEQINQHLKDNKQLRCLDVPKKPRRCLKRQCGKRGVKKAFLKKHPQSEAARKKRKIQSKKKNAENEKSRMPRAKTDVSKQPSPKSNVTMQGFRFLKKTGWLWTPPRCQCSGLWSLCSYEESQLRGRGRLFWRCDSCRKYMDVLANSHLRTMRMPLAHAVAGLKRYFKGKCPPTLESMARDLGHCGLSGTSLQKLRDCLMSAVARVAKHVQDGRQLSGVLEADATSLRKTRLQKSSTLRYFQCFGVVKRGCRQVNLYNIGVSPTNQWN